MEKLNEIFKKDFARTIETVIKADDQEHIFQEVDEYVITKDVSKKLSDFFESYNDAGGTNGVWISGFFGSGKSHLLKILSYALENKEYKCDRGEACAGVMIVARDGCTNSLYAEISLLDKNGVQVGYTNDTLSSALSMQENKMVFNSYEEGVSEVRLAKISCY